ncbi:hypothetical protein RGQ30_31140 [Limnobacter thiooxidans]|uniref:Uncharacterized protein n=1 Tax=Limnobacter thiooxidans TaxID=131080 RepID=A0AA86MC77_9BURK|nr:hypothetical protein RGQ30_31140 [Limnobacter thiooxidans]
MDKLQAGYIHHLTGPVAQQMSLTELLQARCIYKRSVNKGETLVCGGYLRCLSRMINFPGFESLQS